MALYESKRAGRNRVTDARRRLRQDRGQLVVRHAVGEIAGADAFA